MMLCVKTAHIREIFFLRIRRKFSTRERLLLLLCVCVCTIANIIWRGIHSKHSKRPNSELVVHGRIDSSKHTPHTKISEHKMITVKIKKNKIKPKYCRIRIQNEFIEKTKESLRHRALLNPLYIHVYIYMCMCADFN